jgi:hypothetical protein
MKLLIILMLSTFNWPTNDLENDKHPYSIQLVATVQEKSEDFVTLHIEEIIDYGSKIYILPQEGEKLTVRLPARRPPENNTTIIIRLQEKISVGANPSSYIMVDYRTIE